VNNELERMWEEVAIAYFKGQSQHFPRGNEENLRVSRLIFEPGNSQI
jgi:hypothetical protein